MFFLPQKDKFGEGYDKNESKRPPDTDFNQQRLSAWHPVLTAKSALPLFFVVAVIFIPLGVVLLLASNSIVEETISYTHCREESSTAMCSEQLKKREYFANYRGCNCSENITISAPLKGDVYVYYGLTNFYQNHRRYVKSRDDKQLAGKDETISENCIPFQKFENGTSSINFAPCGAIANSIFNDTFTLIYKGQNDNESIVVNMTNKGIAWPSDIRGKFGKPAKWDNTAKPINWPFSMQERYPNGYQEDEELIVWMRNAALPTFRKLHRLVIRTGEFQEGLPAGNYLLKINYAYPVTAFDGTKRFILTTSNWMGGRNNTLAITYLFVGTIHLLFAIVFVFLHIYSSKKNDEFSPNWLKNRTQGQNTNRTVEH